MSILKEAKAGLNDDVFNLVLVCAGYGKKCFQCGKKYIKYKAEDFWIYKRLMRDTTADTDGQPVKLIKTAKVKGGGFYTEIRREIKLDCFFRGCGMS